MSFPTGSISHMLSWLVSEEIKHILCDSSRRGPLKSLHMVSSGLHSGTFSLCWLGFWFFLLKWITSVSTTICCVLWTLLVNHWLGDGLGNPLAHHCSDQTLQLENTVINYIVFNIEIVPYLNYSTVCPSNVQTYFSPLLPIVTYSNSLYFLILTPYVIFSCGAYFQKVLVQLEAAWITGWFHSPVFWKYLKFIAH